MTDSELEEIEQRADRATPGPWYWREGQHVGNKKESDAGGLHTKAPVECYTPDGRRFDRESVIFPVARISGEPYWLERLEKASRSGSPPLCLALECFGKEEDKDFIAHSREDIPVLIAEIRRLRKLLVDAGISC